MQVIIVLIIFFRRAGFGCVAMVFLTSCGPGTFLGTWSDILSNPGQEGTKQVVRREKTGTLHDGPGDSMNDSSVVRLYPYEGRGFWSVNEPADRVHTIIGFENRGQGLLTVREAGPQTGLAVAAGDLNGDGRDDVILGAPESDGPLPEATTSGWVYVLFGRSSFPSTLDLRETVNVSLWAGTSTGRNRLGQTIITADLNDDGVSDVMIGAPYASPHRRRDDRTTSAVKAHAGSVFVLYGRRNRSDASSQSSQIIDLSQRADVVIHGAREGDLAGFALAAGDVNGDGRDDLLIGAPNGRDSAGSGQTGLTYVIHGRPHLPRVIHLSETWDNRLRGIDGSKTRLTLTKNWPDRSGFSLAAGDVNADGIDDVVIGAPFGDGLLNEREDAGECYVIFGGKALPRDIAIGTQADVVIYGTEPFAQSGQMVTTGDLNHDGVGDIVIGVSERSRHVHDGAMRGIRNFAHVVYGGDHLASTLFIKHEADGALTAPSSSRRAFSAPAWETFLPESPGSLSFRPNPILILDQNRDKRDDVLVGLPAARRFAGFPSQAAHALQAAQAVRPGGLKLFLAKGKHGLSHVPRVIQPPDLVDGATFGASLAQGDFNGDGRPDFLVGAPGLQRASRTFSLGLFETMRPIGGGYLFLGTMPQ